MSNKGKNSSFTYKSEMSALPGELLEALPILLIFNRDAYAVIFKSKVQRNMQLNT